MTELARIVSPSEAPPRRWQGIPSITQWRGRLWVTWYTGGPREPSPDNHVVLAWSDDDGLSWHDELVIEAPGSYRAFDPNLWVDPSGRLWHTWNQTDEEAAELFDGVGGVWARVHGDDGWTAPRHLVSGVAMNTPIVRADGAWLLPSARWSQGPGTHPDPRAANVFVSTDEGETWMLHGSARIADTERTFDEHMIVALPDGSLWMILRTLRGLAESFSMDGGVSWSLVRPSGFTPHPSSRVWFSALADGTLVLIGNAAAMTRDGIAVRTSVDGGATWSFPTVVDDRFGLSYPDAVQLDDGRLLVVYDRDRNGDGEIILTALRVEGGIVSVERPAATIDRLAGR